MGFRYHKRVKLGKGVGLNISKSGISPSLRTKYGSISPKGFSIRTGIPGLTYREGKNSKIGGVLLVISVITAGAFMIGWVARKVRHFVFGRKKDSMPIHHNNNCDEKR